MNIIYVGFPGLGFQGKNLCVMFAFSIVSFLFFSEYFVYSRHCTRLEFTGKFMNDIHLQILLTLLVGVVLCSSSYSGYCRCYPIE
jgi:hypothetical protein